MSDEQAFIEDEMYEELLSDFLDESEILLERLDTELLQLEEWVKEADRSRERYDMDELNSMFRSVHSLKGLSAMLGLASVNNLTHKIENIFDAARKEELYFEESSVDLVFRAITKLAEMRDQLVTEGTDLLNYDELESEIQRLLNTKEAFEITPDLPPLSADVDVVVEKPATVSGEQSRSVPPVKEKKEVKEELMTNTNNPAPFEPTDLFHDVTDEGGAPAKYLAIFIDEADMALDQLTEILIHLEKGSTTEQVEQLLITAHRVKGSAASIGLHRPAKLAHFMEDILQVLRETGGELGLEMVDAMLKCTDSLRYYLEGLKEGKPVSETFNEVANELLKADYNAKNPGAQKGTPTTAPEVEISSQSDEKVGQENEPDTPQSIDFSWESFEYYLRETEGITQSVTALE
ncbi:MAG: Hpt domain-containing protein, partial [Pirellulaceae bacterium]|nr:Hpt domain-containing protein [Pirellulaceae bacterium]